MPSCTRVHGENPVSESTSQVKPGITVSRYTCADCDASFLHPHHSSRPRRSSCRSCGSKQLAETSPRVRCVVMTEDELGTLRPLRRTTTRRELKRSLFIRRNWPLRCELKEWLDRLDNLLVRLRVDGPAAQEMKRQAGALLAEVDATQQAFLEQHDQSVRQERVSL